jgi:hypothetical protein
MRLLNVILASALIAPAAGAVPNDGDFFEQFQALAGEWQAELPSFGKISNTIRLVSNGKGIEETIGTPDNNEVSVYVRDNDRILMSHYCAMTSDGHTVRLESRPNGPQANGLLFVFRDAINLHSPSAPHMRRVLIRILDRDHLVEQWTKIEHGKDTVFELDFVRQ